MPEKFYLSNRRLRMPLLETVTCSVVGYWFACSNAGTFRIAGIVTLVLFGLCFLAVLTVMILRRRTPRVTVDDAGVTFAHPLRPAERQYYAWSQVVSLENDERRERILLHLADGTHAFDTEGIAASQYDLFRSMQRHHAAQQR